MPQIIKVAQLDNQQGNYIFRIEDGYSGTIITIPGFGGGRDGPTTPDYPEQEKWMRAHSGLKEVYYLTWECKTQIELDSFIQKLEKLQS